MLTSIKWVRRVVRCIRPTHSNVASKIYFRDGIYGPIGRLVHIVSVMLATGCGRVDFDACVVVVFAPAAPGGHHPGRRICFCEGLIVFAGKNFRGEIKVAKLQLGRFDATFGCCVASCFSNLIVRRFL